MLELAGKRVVCTNIESGERNIGKQKIYAPNDDGKRSGIRPRWCQVYQIGDEVQGIEPGQWVLLKHGRWSQKFVEKDDNGEDRDFWIIDYPDAILLVSDEAPDSDDLSVGM